MTHNIMIVSYQLREVLLYFAIQVALQINVNMQINQNIEFIWIT